MITRPYLSIWDPRRGDVDELRASEPLTAIHSDSPARHGGYAPIRDYASVGDGRTMALVACDGSIDWLCLPDLDSGSVFGALLDAERGGAFRLAPIEPYEAQSRYLPGTNILETTLAMATAHGDPLVLSPRADIEDRLKATTDYWRDWSSTRRYAGPWQDAVVRS